MEDTSINKHILITDIKYIELPDSPFTWPHQYSHIGGLDRLEPLIGWDTKTGDSFVAVDYVKPIELAYTQRNQDGTTITHYYYTGITEQVAEVLGISAEVFDKQSTSLESLTQVNRELGTKVNTLSDKLKESQIELNQLTNRTFWEKITSAIKELWK